VTRETAWEAHQTRLAEIKRDYKRKRDELRVERAYQSFCRYLREAGGPPLPCEGNDLGPLGEIFPPELYVGETRQ